jgi:hypothetical protein
MANVFAVKSGNWNDNTVWDSNIIPTSADTVFTNGYTVTINTDVDVNQLRNGSNSGQLPNMCVPVMTSNTTPSGVASASVNTVSAFNAFNGTGWIASGTAYTLTYQFPVAKTIKRFRVYAGYNRTPNAFTFEGSNDPTFATIAFTYSATMPNVPTNILVSPLLNNTTPCLYYRMNVTTSIVGAGNPIIYLFDMTESGAVTNSATGGNYLVSALPTTPATRTITVSNTTSGIVNASGNVNVLQISATSGILNINHATLGNIVGGGALIASQYNIYALAGCTCTININGNLFGDTLTAGGSARANAAFGIAGAITTNIIGTLTAGNAYATGSCAITILATAGNAVLNITGNLFGQSVNYGSGAGSAAIDIQGLNNATLNITGNITANLFYGIYVSVATYTGNINIITGTVQASVNAPGIYNQGSGTVTLLSPVINNTNVMGVMSQRIKFYPTGISQWRFQDQTGANLTIYSGTGAGVGYPAVDTVRYGSPTYGPTLTEYNGTMRIPDVTNVNKGVEYGYGLVGTAVLTAEDFLNAISTSSNVVATRLKNVSTVQSTGDQIAAFNI